MKLTALIFSILMIIIFLSACYYDSQEYLFPTINNQCDTTGTILFSSVDSVLQNNCVSCHNLSTASGGVNLDGYTNVYFFATTLRNNTPILQGVIRRMSGFSPMPQLPSPSLDECSIRKIEIWIQQGALQN